MAKITSHIWSSARGSVAGITYMTTPSGAIIARQRVKPVNPNTTLQGLIKQALMFGLEEWEGLDVSGRALWALTGSSGRNRFLRAYTSQKYLKDSTGLAISALTVPYLPQFIAGIIAEPITYTGGTGTTGISLKIGPATILSSTKNQFLVQVSRPFKATRYRWQGDWDTTKNISNNDDADSSGNITITGLIPGAIYFVRVSGTLSVEGTSVINCSPIQFRIAATTAP